jgi:hypothetical protein
MGGASNPCRAAARVSATVEGGEVCGTAGAHKIRETEAIKTSPAGRRKDDKAILLTADHPNLVVERTGTSIVKKTPY